MIALAACPLCSTPLDESDLPEHIRANHDIPAPRRHDANWRCAQCGLAVPATDWHWCEPAHPTLDKVSRVRQGSQTIGEFLDWLSDERHYVIAEWHEQSGVLPGSTVSDLHSVGRQPDELLHEYFGIDAKAEEREKRALLDWTRAMAATE